MGSEHYEKYKETYKRNVKRWQKENPDKVREIQRRYRKKHREKINKRQMEYRKENPDKVKKWESNSAEKQRKYRMNLKLNIYKLLGNKCSKCGIGDIRCLQIDHISGGGKQEIESFKGYNTYLRFILKKIESGSKDYQLLCANCNWIKRDKNKECIN